MSRSRLHGTDGIRGRISNFEGDDEAALIALVTDRILSPRSMRIIGEATGIYLNDKVGEQPLVTIGWDRRDGNATLVDSLESGLNASGCRTIRVGELPTPGLHYTILASAADAGMMITASHNPAHDSGVKLFDGDGFKSMPNDEDKISQLAWDLADGSIATPEMSGERLETINGLELYRTNLRDRMENFEMLFNTKLSDLGMNLILDSSGGSASQWLARDMDEWGLSTIEVSSSFEPINHNCGAGELSPLDKWTWDELTMLESEHRIIDAICNYLRDFGGDIPWSDGEIIAAALDGDGDRCLFLMADKEGVHVVDGDHISDVILRAGIISTQKHWKIAASIESDLGLFNNLEHLPNGPHVGMTTAVGDRWLSAALCNNGGMELTKSSSFPALIGTEDSGHIILPMRVPGDENTWGLVGDGAATMIAYLLAKQLLDNVDSDSNFSSGWKNRTSIKPSNRSLWDGKNQLSQMVQNIAQDWCGCELNRVEIEGETSLLFLEGCLENLPITIAVRNSGTEAKTSITVRFSEGINRNGDQLINAISQVLSEQLSTNKQ
ncbi:MAG: hypothetical protein VX906_03120 [Candidatus Thermoplasmatota archaeon]|nr:hypothetical protein [Candidatus Thermoplasmatota archaeon]